MKKSICFLLCFVMLLGCFGTVYADENLKDLTLSVKQKLEISDEYTKLYTETRWDKNGNQVVDFEWSSEDGKIISVSALHSGIITDFYCNESRYSSKISSVSAKEVVKSANNFMSKINPSIAKSYIFSEENVSLKHGVSVVCERIEGTARVDGDYAQIYLNGKDGSVISFYLRYTEYVFEKEDGIISLEEAKEKFGDELNLELCYMVGKDEKIIPVYTDLSKIYENEYAVDAKSGAVINYGGITYRTNTFFGAASGGNMKEDAAADIFLSEEELKELSKYENFISKETAEQQLRKITALGLLNMKLEGASYTKGYFGKTAEDNQMRLLLNFGDENSYATAVLDAKSVKILSFTRREDTEGKNKISSEKAKETVNEFMNSICSEKFVCVYSKENENEYSEKYMKLINNIPYIGNEISVSADLSTGFISVYSNGFDEYVPESIIQPENLIDISSAYKIFGEKSDFELVQYDISGTKAEKFYGTENFRLNEPMYKILYVIKSEPFAIDASSGTALLESGDVFGGESLVFQDISGHWCENAVIGLVENGLMDADEELFGPDEPLTEQDSIRMLKEAGLYKYTGKSNSLEILSRENAVKAIVCGAGFEKAGSLSEIYSPVFNDYREISEEHRGFAALAKGMKIVNGNQNGNFSPKETATRGMFAVMIYNYFLNNEV